MLVLSVHSVHKVTLQRKRRTFLENWPKFLAFQQNAIVLKFEGPLTMKG